MTTLELLSRLRSLGVELRADSDRLRVSAPKGVLTPVLRAELTDNKEEILAFLRAASVASSSNPPRLRPIPRDGDLPPSFSQQRLWFLDQMEPDSPVYNISRAMRINGALNVEALQRTLDALVARHEVLRTTFASPDGSPVQVIAKSRSVELPVTDLRDWPLVEREVEAQRFMVEHARRPFNLSQDLMLRARLLRMDEQEHHLLLTMHHIASDAWSEGILYRELATLYEAFSTGKPSPLPELPIQYADFAQWQREWLQGEVLESRLSYWKQQLGDYSAVLELPTDRPRPLVQTYQGRRQSLALPKTLSDSLQVLCRQERSTLFMILLAAFQVLLHRYTGQDDIVVGTPIAGRTQAETEGLIGFFVNNLVLRTDISGNPTFRELLGRVREVTLEAYTHQDLPFEKLVEELHPDRNLSYSPLFQAMFDFQNAPKYELELAGLTLTPLEVDSGTAKFDLSLSLSESPYGLTGALGYNTDLFDHATITRMLGHFRTLLEGVVDNPDQLVSELPLLTEGERHQLRVEWNDTQTEYPKDSCIHQLFESQVERTPEAVAMDFEEDRLTYRELNRGANQLAHYLNARGIGPENVVGLYMERSAAMVIAILGIVKAGGAYLPLDPSFPPGRLKFMIEDSGATLVLTHRLSEEHSPAPTIVDIIDLDLDSIEIVRMSVENPTSQTTPGSLLYVMYTSGSTGVPKGIGVCHRGVTRLVCKTNYIDLDESDRVAQASNAAFDAATFELWGALLNGARIVGIPKALLLSPVKFARHLEQHRITTIFLTTALFNQIVQTEPAAFKGMSQVLVGGEALDPHWLSVALEHGPPKRLLNVYGPTENTTFTTWYLVERVPEGATTVPIGRPLANSLVYILDSHLNPVPIGVSGELHIGGSGLARGYLNSPDLTAEKFIPSPFGGETGARLYKTGDLARYRSDGNIEFLGRIDHQVKVRGFRVELGEVQVVLQQHSRIREAVVTTRESSSGDLNLVAYLVPEVDQTPKVGELREFLKQKLPDYMVPSAFVFLDILPLTPNGKTDWQALPAPDQARPELDSDFAEPDTPMQLMVAQAWREALEIDQVGLYDNFFDLGGHSLLAMKVIAKLEKSTGLKIGPREIMFQTLGQLAATYEVQNVLPHPAGSPRRSRRLLSGIKNLVFHRNGGHSEELRSTEISGRRS